MNRGKLLGVTHILPLAAVHGTAKPANGNNLHTGLQSALCRLCHDDFHGCQSKKARGNALEAGA